MRAYRGRVDGERFGFGVPVAFQPDTNRKDQRVLDTHCVHGRREVHSEGGRGGVGLQGRVGGAAVRAVHLSKDKVRVLHLLHEFHIDWVLHVGGGKREQAAQARAVHQTSLAGLGGVVHLRFIEVELELVQIFAGQGKFCLFHKHGDNVASSA